MPGNNHRQIHVSRGAIRHLLLFLPPTEEAIIQAVHQNENNRLCSSLDITDNWAVPQISAEQPVLAGFSMLLSASHLSRDIESVLYVGWNWLFLWFFFLSFTFSRWISFLIWDILIFMASSSSSGTSGMLGTASDSSTIWKLRSVSGMYHLQSYCWLFLKDRRSKPLLLTGAWQILTSSSYRSLLIIAHKIQK